MSIPTYITNRLGIHRQVRHILDILDGDVAPWSGSILDDTTIGLGHLKVARFKFDATGDTTMRTVAAHGLMGGETIPDNAIILGGGMEILTTFTSADDSATIAIHVNAANDLVTATAISSGTFWDAVKYKVVVPDGLAAAGVATPVKLTAAREVTATVAVQALTAGKLVGWLMYVVGE